MIDWLMRNRNVIVPLCLVFFSLVSISRNSLSRDRREGSASHFSRGLISAFSYVQKGITYTLTGIRDLGRNYLFLRELREENLKLQKEIALLTRENLELRERALENERLRQLLDFKDLVTYKLVPAQVIAGDLSATSKMITINKGFLDGVRPGMAVVSHEGAVGQVVEEPGKPIAPHAARVLLIIDRMSRVDAMLQRHRDRGVIYGRPESESLEMRYLDGQTSVKVGDVVITSGMGGVYPKGLMIGTVREVKSAAGALGPLVIVEPSVDFSRVEEVLIIFPESEIQ